MQKLLQFPAILQSRQAILHMVEWVMCMNLILSAVLLKEHTRWQQALVSEFPDPRPVVITHNCDHGGGFAGEQKVDTAGRGAPPQES